MGCAADIVRQGCQFSPTQPLSNERRGSGAACCREFGCSCRSGFRSPHLGRGSRSASQVVFALKRPEGSPPKSCADGRVPVRKRCADPYRACTKALIASWSTGTSVYVRLGQDQGEPLSANFCPSPTLLRRCIPQLWRSQMYNHQQRDQRTSGRPGTLAGQSARSGRSSRSRYGRSASTWSRRGELATGRCSTSRSTASCALRRGKAADRGRRFGWRSSPAIDGDPAKDRHTCFVRDRRDCPREPAHLAHPPRRREA